MSRVNGYTKERFLEIKERLHRTERLDQLQINWLYNFASLVFEDLNLDLSKPPTYFEVGESDYGTDELNDIQGCMALGEEVGVYCGYFTDPEPYRLIPVRANGDICAKCKGKGCDDWAGEDCPSDEQKLIRVQDLPDA